jgi:cytochrome c oxidase cbb3-type subunit 4
MGTVRGLITLVLMVAFIALVVWLFNSRNKHRFDAAAKLPLEDQPPSDDSKPDPTKRD